MASLTVLVWLTAVLSFILFLDADKVAWGKIQTALTITTFISLLIAAGIYYDLHRGNMRRVVDDPVPFVFLWGLAELGVNAIGCGWHEHERRKFVARMLTARGQEVFQSVPLRTGITVTSAISFIASLLGIVSFYLDYLWL
jgi:hypothetical protein